MQLVYSLISTSTFYAIVLLAGATEQEEWDSARKGFGSLVAMNCPTEHWSTMPINVAGKDCYYYDP